VWEILGAVKTEFGNFGTVLEKTKKKLQEAANVVELAGVRSRVIERKLRKVQELPEEAPLDFLSDAVEAEAADEAAAAAEAALGGGED
jgi:DNA recombination protein RmuC